MESQCSCSVCVRGALLPASHCRSRPPRDSDLPPSQEQNSSWTLSWYNINSKIGSPRQRPGPNLFFNVPFSFPEQLPATREQTNNKQTEHVYRKSKKQTTHRYLIIFKNCYNTLCIMIFSSAQLTTILV